MVRLRATKTKQKFINKQNMFNCDLELNFAFKA